MGERLIVLDAVLADRNLAWLGTEFDRFIDAALSG